MISCVFNTLTYNRPFILSMEGGVTLSDATYYLIYQKAIPQ